MEFAPSIAIKPCYSSSSFIHLFGPFPFWFRWLLDTCLNKLHTHKPFRDTGSIPPLITM